MFYMGIGPDGTDTSTQVIVIKMFLKNIKKHYEVVKFLSFPLPMTDPGSKHHILRLYQDNDYISNKRLFSQDKRPTRTIRANPKLIIQNNVGTSDLVNDLRALKTPVESIWPQHTHGWEKYTHGKALGDDYKVGIYDLLKNCIHLYVQHRLIIKTPDEEISDCLEKMKAAFEKNPVPADFLFNISEHHTPIILMSLPLWFREKIPYNRSYKA